MNNPRTSARRTSGRPAWIAETLETAAERWLPVVGYEGLYEVSDLGRVRSIRRNGTLGGILKPQRKRYLTVNLWRSDKMRTVTIHSLVAMAFLGPYPTGMEVCHGPAGRFDNRLANLSYGTLSKNRGPDKYRDGTMQAGIRNANAKLNDQAVRDIRRRAAAGASHLVLAREYGVCDTTVRNVVAGFTWRHVS